MAVIVNFVVSRMIVWLLMIMLGVKPKLLKIESLKCAGAARNHYELFSTEVQCVMPAQYYVNVQNLLMIIAVFRAFLALLASKLTIEGIFINFYH